MTRSTGRFLLISFAGALLLTLLCALGALKRVDRWVQDAMYQREQMISDDIVVIGIDEEALEKLGGYGTWDRTVMAGALGMLARDPQNLPAVVVIDTLYSGETEEEADTALSEAVRKLPSVVTASSAVFGEEIHADDTGRSMDSFAILKYEEPYDALKEAATVGHINAMLDMDGIMRHALLYISPDKTEKVYSLSHEAARLYMEKQGEAMGEPPVNERGQFYVPYTAGPGTWYDGVSIASLIAGEVPPDYYAGKIVLIGPFAAGLQDSYYTPIDRSAPMYGVEFHANIIEMFLNGSFKKEASDILQLLLLFIICFAALFVFLRFGLIPSAAACAGITALSLICSAALYQNGHVLHPLWIPFGVILLFLISIAYRYVNAALERQQVTRTFERYVAPQIVKEILKEGTESLSLGGKLCEIAVLFVDVRGFTTMSERMKPEEVVYILNRYLTMTSACIERNRGTLDKFVGDATMAFWGAPLPEPDSIYLAVKTAQEIVEGAERLSEDLNEEIGEELRVGVGVHFGPAVVGNMGSERRMDFTAIGDTVNTAARLEANAPGGKVYISRVVADALSERITTVSLGDTVRLKGKKEGFEVLELKEIL
ncbi:MAG TPA: adenylate/guanylate cyclase domain-containing protein [Lachnospiraceae bacterium]|nr:adenylate/guanylate cyclase domain-containing protein [Lachnospiraceae bacterium]